MIFLLFILTIVATFYFTVGVTDSGPSHTFTGICIGAGAVVLLCLLAFAIYLQSTLQGWKPLIELVFGVA